MNERTQSTTPLTRRQVLLFGWVASLTALFAQVGLMLARFIKPVSSAGFGGMIYAGKLNEFEPGSVNRILAGRFYVVRLDEGFLALSQRCTHLGCSVPWAETERAFHCPCHGSLFTVVGEVEGGPAPRPLDYYPIDIRGDELWVDTSQAIQRAHFDASQLTRV